MVSKKYTILRTAVHSLSNTDLAPSFHTQTVSSETSTESARKDSSIPVLPLVTSLTYRLLKIVICRINLSLQLYRATKDHT
jgi:hypothetical protein